MILPCSLTPVPFSWRREGDSNPRYTFVGIHTISSRAPSASRASLHIGDQGSEKILYDPSLFPVVGGERGIRTPVRAFGPQIDFESIPLRPLRYLSAGFIMIPNWFLMLSSSHEKIYSKFRRRHLSLHHRLLPRYDSISYREGACKGKQRRRSWDHLRQI